MRTGCDRGRATESARGRTLGRRRKQVHRPACPHTGAPRWRWPTGALTADEPRGQPCRAGRSASSSTAGCSADLTARTCFGPAGTGFGSGVHCASESLPFLRSGSLPVARESAIWSSTHALPPSEPECVVPPGRLIRLDFGKRLRTSSAPENGVAASSSSLISRIGGALLPSTFGAVPALAGQYRHGALYHALAQVSNGAHSWMRQLSPLHFFQLVGHCVSVHSTPM